MTRLLLRVLVHSLAASTQPEASASVSVSASGLSSTFPTAPPITITYWAGRGRCEPLRCILAAAGVPFENNFLSCKDDYARLLATGKLGYSQVPLVEIDGSNLVQCLPTALYLAERFDLCPSDPRGRYDAGRIYAAAQDAREPLLNFPFHGDEEKALAEVSGSKGLLRRYATSWEGLLGSSSELPSGGPFFLGERPSFADVGVFEVMDFFRQVYGEDDMRSSFGLFPKLLALHDAVLGLGRLRTWRDVERPRVFISDWSSYADVVKATLA